MLGSPLDTINKIKFCRSEQSLPIQYELVQMDPVDSLAECEAGFMLLR